MAHEIDITDGVASFAGREHAWHRLGVTVNARTATDALDAAKLSGWNVRKRPIFVEGDPVITADGVSPAPMLAVPDRYATVRTNPVTGGTDPLGVVGTGYEVVQNEAHAEMLDTIAGESGAVFESAGALRGGRETFMTMRLPNVVSVQVGGRPDNTDMYLVALNSHDGSSAFRVLVTPVRVVCANTQAAALRNMVSSVAVRHTSNARTRIEQAHRVLGLADAWATAWQEESERLLNIELGHTGVADFFKEFAGVTVLGAPATSLSDRQRATRQETAATLDAALTLSETIPAAGRWTAWGAYNAVTEWADHDRKVIGRGLSAEERADRRALQAVTGSGAELKQRAFALLSK